MEGLKKLLEVLSHVLGAAAVIALVFTFTALGSGTEDAYAAGFESAVNIAVNTDVVGSLESDSDVDYYKFTVSSDGHINITFNRPLQGDNNRYWNICLYDGNYNEIGAKDAYGNYSTTICPAVGVGEGRTYYIKIEKYYYSSDNYTLNVVYEAGNDWECELNDSFIKANKIDTDIIYYGSLYTDSDKDFFVFSAPSDGAAELIFTNDQLGDSDGYWLVYLYDCNYKEICSMKCMGNYTRHIFPVIGLRGGYDYYIGIDKYYYSSTTYGVKLSFDSSNNWEKEFNDEYTDSTPIRLDKTYNGSLRESDDVDLYRFEIEREGQYEICFEHDLLSDSDKYWNLEIKNNAYEEVSSYEIKGNIEKSSYNISLSPGVYYIRITDYYYSSIPYKILVKSDDYVPESSSGLDVNGEVCPYDSINGSSYEKIQAFIWRMYKLALGRSEVREDEINYWSRMLYNHERTGADMAFQFCCGDEFKNRNLSDDEFSKIMYRVYMNRERGEGDKDGWTIPLANGANRKWIMAKFVNSPEYTMICWDYGIDRGTLDVPESEQFAPN